MLLGMVMLLLLVMLFNSITSNNLGWISGWPGSKNQITDPNSITSHNSVTSPNSIPSMNSITMPNSIASPTSITSSNSNKK